MFRLILICCFMIQFHEAVPIIDSIKSMFRSLIPTVGVDVSVGSPDPNPEDAKHPVLVHPEVNPGLFEGDIVLPPEVKLRGAPIDLSKYMYEATRWPNGIVPYFVNSHNYGAPQEKMIRSAMDTIESMSCIKFIPWNEKTEDYLNITDTKNGGCWSSVGKTKGAQKVGLAAPMKSRAGHCFTTGTIIHELLHSLGFCHEQSRLDRDEYVKINWENIAEGQQHNFEKRDVKAKFPYDYDSIMHYGKDFFSKGKGKPTITVLKPGYEIGLRGSLSKTDCMELNDFYNCDNNPKSRIKYSDICNSIRI